MYLEEGESWIRNPELISCSFSTLHFVTHPHMLWFFGTGWKEFFFFLFSGAVILCGMVPQCALRMSIFLASIISSVSLLCWRWCCGDLHSSIHGLKGRGVYIVRIQVKWIAGLQKMTASGSLWASWFFLFFIFNFFLVGVFGFFVFKMRSLPEGFFSLSAYSMQWCLKSYGACQRLGSQHHY